MEEVLEKCPVRARRFHLDVEPPKDRPNVDPPLTNFDGVFDFPKMEEEVLQMWREKDAFRTSLKQSEGKKPFTFFDGPPFATGLPHYGHLLAGTIKDMVTRFAHQTGHHVVRRFGWDCHGLPVEYEIDKMLNIKSSHDVERIGIPAYNEACEGIVMKYSGEWRRTVERMGRWIDFDNGYMTMQLSYMESVWWVFSQLWKKDMVYRGYRVMPYSTTCTTPLSNFEANLNYKDVSDPSVTIAFRSSEDDNTYFLAWTTTPWTLPSNLALCVGKEVDYVKVRDAATGRCYILAEDCLPFVYPAPKKSKKAAAKQATAESTESAPYEIMHKCKGDELAGKTYRPLFPYFETEYKSTAFRVLMDNYVSTESGTGIVHQAPGFGEDDYRICLENGVIAKGERIPCPVDENGCFTAEVTPFCGRYVKEADPAVLAHLEQQGSVVQKGSVVHSYPFCWRSDTPLLYKAVESWFVKVESIRERLVACNESSHWVPDVVKSKRFSNWLADAHDWNVSRNRYWGTPIPIWHSEDWEEVVCVGSVAELEELSGVTTKITNLHRHHIDQITIPSKRPGVAPLRRVPFVFDCWFESGSMPYAQQHYPFEEKDNFKNVFPADFVAEGLDQTRGWFYTLLVLGVMLFDACPFHHVVVNGMILAEDGKKMSKRLKNYPEPEAVINQHGADALRMYVINSPVVRAEPLRFREAGVKNVVKDILLPLMNATKFFIDNANQCIVAGGVVSVENRSNDQMDRWIIASTQTLLHYVRQEMGQFHLYNVVPGILRFVIDFSNWYVRLNRARMKRGCSIVERSEALSTTLSVLFSVSRILAHIAPFVAEMIYQKIKPILPKEDQVDSVHYLMVPEEDETLRDAALEKSMERMMTIVDMVRAMRDRLVIPLKRPLMEVQIVHPDNDYLDSMSSVMDYIRRETNAFCINTKRESEYVVTHLDVNFEVLGRRLRQELPRLRKAVQAMTKEEVSRFIENKGGEVAGTALTLEDVKIVRKVKEGIKQYTGDSDNDVVVLVDGHADKTIIGLWQAREFVNRVQQLRKKAKLSVSDQISIYFETEDDELKHTLLGCEDTINTTLIKGTWHTMDKLPADAESIAEEENSISNIPIRLVFTKRDEA